MSHSRLLPFRIGLRCCLSACLVSALGGSAAAQSLSGKIQPNRLDFGVVRVGNTVEGSFLVTVPGDSTDGVPYGALPPSFVTCTKSTIQLRKFGNQDSKISCRFSVRLSTKKVGRFSGTAEAMVGIEKYEIPVTVEVVAKDDKALRVLVLETPFDAYSTSDAAIFKSWLDVVNAGNLDVDYRDADRSNSVTAGSHLPEYDSLLLSEGGLISLSEDDVERINQFVTSGGRLIVCANSFFVGTIEKANQLLRPHGLELEDREVFRTHTVVEDEIVEDPLTKDVKRLMFRRTSPVKVLKPDQGRILVKAPDNSETGVIAVTRAGKGEIVVLGQSLWWAWIGQDVNKDFDNALMLLNLLRGDQQREP